MRKAAARICLSQATSFITALRFSALDPSAQINVKREMFFFNNSRMAAISAVVLVLQTINMVHVIGFSKSGLATPNNRQYFAMYLILFMSAGLCLGARHVLRDRPALLQRFYVGFALIWVVWHALISSMDLRTNPNLMVFTTGILAIALLVQATPVQMLSILASGLALLLFSARAHLTSGGTVNALIVTIMAMLIFCSRYFSLIEALRYRQKMILLENHRQIEKQKLALMSDQQAALLRHSRDILFLWDKALDTLTFSGGISLCTADREALLAWLAQARAPDARAITLRLTIRDIKDPAREYWIESTRHLDRDGTVIGAAGLMATKC
ncbi:MAG: hypothetical protein RSA65_01750 [Clostridia bacterium]